MTGPADEERRAPAAPPEAARIFGAELERAQRFADHLADTGISHGLIGPREVPRLWERHILNCAVIGAAMPEGASVIDVGSGAGLPGIAVALARPDLSVLLVEPMERRTTWLSTVIADLELDSVQVRRDRAEDVHGDRQADVVTARAVAALDKLARWCLPLVTPGGRLVAMKGSSAQREIDEAQGTLTRLGGANPRIELCGADVLAEPTTVIVIDKVEPARGRAARPRRPR
ncbi:MAG: 16S rRNA (guanine(527)-N(7))-methyltransferase RsmG [Actinomycetia bacterium]|nr:16S rRNA (guanine(527)-N(7))-methyltransferase RsmG [Actinomycetes bacterium]